MGHFDIFPYVWLTLVAGMGIVSLVKGVYEFRSGQARARWFGGYGEAIGRQDAPFYYWMIVVGDFVGVVIASFMFWMGLDFLKW